MGLESIELLVKLELEFGVHFSKTDELPRTPNELARLILEERNNARSYFTARLKPCDEKDILPRVTQIIAQTYGLADSEIHADTDLSKLR